jgi:hypothetical protein
MFATYRFQGPPSDLAALQRRIKDAVTFFYAEFQHLPAAVVVNKKSATDAARAVDALGFKLPVNTGGDCLLDEVWLEMRK